MSKDMETPQTIHPYYNGIQQENSHKQELSHYLLHSFLLDFILTTDYIF